MRKRMDGARDNRLEMPSIYPGVHTMVLAWGEQCSNYCCSIEEGIVELPGQNTRISLPFSFPRAFPA